MKTKNPFYPLLLVVAVVFCITACSYLVMTLKRRAESTLAPSGEASGLVVFFDDYGTHLLIGLLVALAVCTVAAMSIDDYWNRRTKVRAKRASRDDE